MTKQKTQLSVDPSHAWLQVVNREEDMDRWFERYLESDPESTVPFSILLAYYKHSCSCHGSRPFSRNLFSSRLRYYLASNPYLSPVVALRTDRLCYKGVRLKAEETEERTAEAAILNP